MPEESKAPSAAAEPSDAAAEKSTIQFTYLDIDNSIEVVQAIRSLGGDTCDFNQLATKLGVSAEGGGFRMRILTAKTYGFLTYEKGVIRLTDLGIRAADPQKQKRARYDAFMSVALYKQLFDRLNGQPLPPPAAIELMMERLGVAKKLKEKARQVFTRAAKNAGLFELASDRLTTPPGLDSGMRAAEPTPDSDGNRARTGGGEPPSSLHPFIDGLLRTLPRPETDWPLAARAKWLQAAANIFDLIYVDLSTENRVIKIGLQKTEAIDA